MTFFELLCSCSLVLGAGGGLCAGVSWGFLGVVVGLVVGGALGVGTYIALMAVAAGIASVAGARRPGAKPSVENAAALPMFAAGLGVALVFTVVGALLGRP